MTLPELLCVRIIDFSFYPGLEFYRDHEMSFSSNLRSIRLLDTKDDPCRAESLIHALFPPCWTMLEEIIIAGDYERKTVEDYDRRITEDRTFFVNRLDLRLGVAHATTSTVRHVEGGNGKQSDDPPFSRRQLMTTRYYTWRAPFNPSHDHGLDTGGPGWKKWQLFPKEKSYKERMKLAIAEKED